MAMMVCPWWMGYFLLFPWRRRVQDPRRILSPYVKQGMTVLEPGCGMGYFTLELARLVGETGKVVAVDLQQKMLDGLVRRSRKAGVDRPLETRLAKQGSLGTADLSGKVDFALLFALVHEVPDAAGFLAQIASALSPGKQALFCEPSGHVSEEDFARSLALCEQAGLRVESRPAIWHSHAALLVRA